jgi:DNA polymerase-3 subunit delta'
LENGRLGHAYLLTGDRLEFLEGAARTLAQVLNCRNPVGRLPAGFGTAPCDQCASCRRILTDNHPDVQWWRPESKLRIITIDQVRSLRQSIHLKPLEAKYKVAVIVAADRLNPQAANAFLKTLEEPPENSVLLLLTTEPQRVIETIQSRCLRLACGDPGTSAATREPPAYLREFSDGALQEKGKDLLSRYRLLAVLQRHLADVRSRAQTDLTARSPLEKYEDADPGVREKWEQELSAAMEAEYRLRRSEMLAELHGWLRDIWLATLRASPALFIHASLASTTEAVAHRLETNVALENLRILEKTCRLLQTNVQESLTLEVCLLRLNFGR